MLMKYSCDRRTLEAPNHGKSQQSTEARGHTRSGPCYDLTSFELLSSSELLSQSAASAFGLYAGVLPVGIHVWDRSSSPVGSVLLSTTVSPSSSTSTIGASPKPVHLVAIAFRQAMSSSSAA